MIKLKIILASFLVCIIPLIIFGSALFAWKEPVLFDGNYTTTSIVAAVAFIAITFAVGPLVKVNGKVPFINLIDSQESTVGKVKFIFKMLLSLFLAAFLLYFSAKNVYFFSIQSKANNAETSLMVKVEKVRRASYSQTKNTATVFSYEHQSTFKLHWKKKELNQSLVGSCLMLSGDGNEHGKYIRSFYRVECPN